MKATATFAGGCFWCTQHDLEQLPGVIKTTAGYIDERESTRVEYDSKKISFKKLCQFFLDHIDPTDAGGQFYDRGTHYQTAIFYSNDIEKNIAESLLQELTASGIYDKPIAVEILPRGDIARDVIKDTKGNTDENLHGNFVNAEEYHQHYAQKNPDHYIRYRQGYGREAFVQNVCQIREEKKIQWKD